MHLIDTGHHVMGASAVVSTHIPQAVGYAFALKQKGADGWSLVSLVTGRWTRVSSTRA